MNLTLSILFIALNVMDVVSTRRALKRPGLWEGNPVISWLMRHGNVWIVAKMALAALALWFLRDSPLPLAGVCAIYAIVVYRNFKLAR